jgi:hypothetical protein
MNAWLRDHLSTTSSRIVVSIALAVLDSQLLIVGILFMQWEPTAMQLKVLIGIGAMILTMMGFDVAQFIAAAKAGIAAAAAEAAK